MPNKTKGQIIDKLPKDELGRYKEICRRIGLLLKELEKLDDKVQTEEMADALKRNGIPYREINEPPTFES